MDFNSIVFQKENGIAYITLNRPEALNAVTPELASEVWQALQRCEEDEDIRVVVLKGAGRSFCAGDDLSDDTSVWQKVPLQMKTYMDLIRALRNLRKPVIASLHGHVYGAGCELALASDFRIAAEGARFAEPYVKVGLTAGQYLLPRYIGLGRATEMLLTGDAIDAEEAQRIGMVNRVVPIEELEATVGEWAARFAKAATAAIGATKTALNRGLSVDLDKGLEYSHYAGIGVMQTEDFNEGMQAFAEKREPHFKGK